MVYAVLKTKLPGTLLGQIEAHCTGWDQATPRRTCSGARSTGVRCSSLTRRTAAGTDRSSGRDTCRDEACDEGPCPFQAQTGFTK